MGAEITFCWAGRSDGWVVFRPPVIPTERATAPHLVIPTERATAPHLVIPTERANAPHLVIPTERANAPHLVIPTERATRASGGIYEMCGAGPGRPARTFLCCRAKPGRCAGGTPAPQNLSPIVRPLWGRRLACRVDGWFTVRAPEGRPTCLPDLRADVSTRLRARYPREAGRGRPCS